jgi:hypothetical protein
MGLTSCRRVTITKLAVGGAGCAIGIMPTAASLSNAPPTATPSSVMGPQKLPAGAAAVPAARFRLRPDWRGGDHSSSGPVCPLLPAGSHPNNVRGGTPAAHPLPYTGVRTRVLIRSSSLHDRSRSKAGELGLAQLSGCRNEDPDVVDSGWAAV